MLEIEILICANGMSYVKLTEFVVLEGERNLDVAESILRPAILLSKPLVNALDRLIVRLEHHLLVMLQIDVALEIRIAFIIVKSGSKRFV